MKRTMYIYLGEAHKKWNYCGGACAVIAESLEEAQNILSTDVQCKLLEENTILEEDTSASSEYIYAFTLTKIIKVSETEEKGVIFCNYNWA